MATKQKKDIMLKQVQDKKEVMVIEKEINPLLIKAKKISISSTKDMTAATEALSQLNLAKDNITAKLKSITDPAKEGIKAAEAIYKPFINAAKEAVEYIREMMSEYQTEQKRIADDEANRIAARVGEGKGKLKAETASQKINEIDAPEENIMAASGSLRFETKKVFEVIDITLLPVDYILPNEVKIRAAMNAGTELPGVRYFTKEVPYNSR